MKLLNIIQGKMRKLFKGEFVRGVAILTSASGAQSLILLGSSPILSRLFSPSEFGIAALLYSLAVVPVVICSGQYYVAIGLEKRLANAVGLIVLSLVLILFSSILIFPATIYVANHPAFLRSSISSVAQYLWMIPLFMVVESGLSVGRFWEVRYANYKSIVRNRLMESLVMAGSQIAFGLIGLGPMGLIAGRWLGLFIAGVDISRAIIRQLSKRVLLVVRVQRLKFLAAKHWQFPAYQASAMAVGELGRQGAPIILGLFYSPISVGLYWFSQRILQRPSMLLGANVGRVFYQQAADIKRDGKRISRPYWKATGILAAICILPFGIVALFGPDLFAIIFGAEWYRAGQFAQWMTLSSFGHVIHFPARTCTALFDMQRFFAVIEAVRLVASAASIIFVAYTGGDDIAAIGTFSVVQLAITLMFIAIVGGRLRQSDRTQMARATVGS